jgi:hypothetical protein
MLDVAAAADPIILPNWKAVRRAWKKGLAQRLTALADDPLLVGTADRVGDGPSPPPDR